MNSSRLTVIWLSGLILLASGEYSRLQAQTDPDTSYASRGARPYDEPVDPDRYLIRPGERLEVVFLGAKLGNLSLTVNSEGRLVHRELGVFDLADLTLTQARDTLIEPLQRLYHADDIVISVTSIYPVAIQVTGLVNRPGTYVGYTSQRVSEIIDSAGGIAPGGSTRRIGFLGGPADIAVDLDPYRYASDKRFNPCLNSGHRLHVPARNGAEVQIIGGVLSPRAIELLSGESVNDLIRLAGGTMPDADPAAAYLINDADRSLTPGTSLRAGDVVVIPDRGDEISDLSIKLFGFVSRPGLYDPVADLTLSGLLHMAGGTGPEANSDRITVFRWPERDGQGRRPAGRYPLMSLDGDRLALRPGDSVFVPRRVGYVRLAGLVNRPGLVPYVVGHTVEDYVRLSGGYSDSGSGPEFELFDRISGLTRLATMGTIVYDGDLITVRKGDEN